MKWLRDRQRGIETNRKKEILKDKIKNRLIDKKKFGLKYEWKYK